ncbi:MAG TPA: Hsp20/alpha crystallin family protein [Sulfurovum sp.]|nr:MAG: heat-shock protein Hsp20 [Sulfurovum sp. 16-42-52]OZA47048.1 MAG: heat-shock protein Hsp20 [Sulfurovum sp. 17-42-90]OZA60115.1 MAG: heat-shock protein Hsp20 [Sulfurovum sp. 39-42-12]HQR73411.1 Hsp20/alpha crystallin family protein [Sulfurovum sp.]HQS71666.1 Hsp20/alpha crystallin family protein [Sulfurovum sp.]
MYVTQYNPAKELQEFRKGFKYFDSFLDNLLENKASLSKTDFSPTVNTREGEHAYHVEVDLPGVKKEDIHVDIKENVLTISGERKTKKEIQEEDYYKIESAYGKFERSFTLPENIDVENIHAESQDGVLEVIIPKLGKVDKQPKRIEIK